ncbi:protein disulfide isomerase [Encephalitozoon cuniculi EcunIII-L]|uniref:Protein disulfide isomerase n=1 Tax=Encephalitozoon cuniculi TaxID=6035 RepID=M1K5N1_ENCCN|nr:protein disulfide isomerase [Encephalitozoon cuniculi]KMV65336.1 protein disulfide isomerase [Encephalitozoon cuniculi EcunIII-L]
MFGSVFTIALFAGYTMGEGIHGQDIQVLDRLKIVPSPSMIGMLKDMKSIFSYVSEDEKFEGEGVEIKHDGRMFVVPKAEDVEGAVDVLRKYPAPTEEIVKVMKSGSGGLNSKQGNFIVYFLDGSGYKADLRSNMEGSSAFISTDLSLASELEVPVPGIYGHNASDDLSYKLSFSNESTKKILSLSNLPVFGFTSAANISLYRSFDGTIFYIFFDTNRGEDIMKEYSGSLDSFRSDVRVILIPSLKGNIDIGEYGLAEENLPGCVSISEDGGKYVLKNANRESLVGFVRDVLDKKAEIFYKSQEEPEDNSSRSVKVVTRNNIKSHLEDVGKDRLIVFGTERCPHCIRVKPIVEKLGEIAKDNADGKVLVGYCDVDLNDITDLEIRFVPTLLLFKAGGKESVQYSGGERNLQNLISFIRESGGLGIDLSKFVPAEPEQRRFEAGDDAKGPREDDIRAEL